MKLILVQVSFDFGKLFLSGTTHSYGPLLSKYPIN